MADGIYVGMSGAAARAAQLDAVADNLANAETPGFKATRAAFQAFLPGGSRGAARTDKVLAAAVGSGIDMRPGVMITTDLPLDVVPNDARFLAVATPGGGRAFTRNGHIEVTADGALLIAGNPVLGAGGAPLRVPAGARPEIRPNGDLVVEGSVVDRVGLFELQGPLGRSGPALIAPATGATVTPVDGTLRIGGLEAGNASALDSMVAMITAQRNFESTMQAIQTYRNLDQKAIDVGRVR